MKALMVMAILSMPLIAYLPASFWTLCGDPWCLSVYPGWLDRFIYSKALPYLSPDMVVAASEMEFIEVWIMSTIIMEIFLLSIYYLLKDKFRDDD